jgi:hypothetical protein
VLVRPTDELKLLGSADESDRPSARTPRIRLVTHVDFGDVKTVDLHNPTNVVPIAIEPVRRDPEDRTLAVALDQLVENHRAPRYNGSEEARRLERRPKPQLVVVRGGHRPDSMYPTPQKASGPVAVCASCAALLSVRLRRYELRRAAWESHRNSNPRRVRRGYLFSRRQKCESYSRSADSFPQPY